MNSRNHIMFGSVVSWMYRKLAGVVPLEAGFTRVAIRPAVPPLHSNLTAMSARVATPHGDVVVEWNATATTLRLSVEVPVGAAAALAIPLRTDDTPANNVSITEGRATRRPVWLHGRFVPGVRGLSRPRGGADGAAASPLGSATATTGEAIELEVGSGQYHFIVSSDRQPKVERV